jgi:hypothetical protein
VCWCIVVEPREWAGRWEAQLQGGKVWGLTWRAPGAQDGRQVEPK